MNLETKFGEHTSLRNNIPRPLISSSSTETSAPPPIIKDVTNQIMSSPPNSSNQTTTTTGRFASNKGGAKPIENRNHSQFYGRPMERMPVLQDSSGKFIADESSSGSPQNLQTTPRTLEFSQPLVPSHSSVKSRQDPASMPSFKNARSPPHQRPISNLYSPQRQRSSEIIKLSDVAEILTAVTTASPSKDKSNATPSASSMMARISEITSIAMASIPTTYVNIPRSQSTWTSSGSNGYSSTITVITNSQTSTTSTPNNLSNSTKTLSHSTSTTKSSVKFLNGPSIVIAATETTSNPSNTTSSTISEAIDTLSSSTTSVKPSSPHTVSVNSDLDLKSSSTTTTPRPIQQNDAQQVVVESEPVVKRTVIVVKCSPASGVDAVKAHKPTAMSLSHQTTNTCPSQSSVFDDKTTTAFIPLTSVVATSMLTTADVAKRLSIRSVPSGIQTRVTAPGLQTLQPNNPGAVTSLKPPVVAKSLKLTTKNFAIGALKLDRANTTTVQTASTKNTIILNPENVRGLTNPSSIPAKNITVKKPPNTTDQLFKLYPISSSTPGLFSLKPGSTPGERRVIQLLPQSTPKNTVGKQQALILPVQNASTTVNRQRSLVPSTKIPVISSSNIVSVSQQTNTSESQQFNQHQHQTITTSNNNLVKPAPSNITTCVSVNISSNSSAQPIASIPPSPILVPPKSAAEVAGAPVDICFVDSSGAVSTIPSMTGFSSTSQTSTPPSGVISIPLSESAKTQTQLMDKELSYIKSKQNGWGKNLLSNKSKKSAPLCSPVPYAPIEEPFYVSDDSSSVGSAVDSSRSSQQQQPFKYLKTIRSGGSSRTNGIEPYKRRDTIIIQQSSLDFLAKHQQQQQQQQQQQRQENADGSFPIIKEYKSLALFVTGGEEENSVNSNNKTDEPSTITAAASTTGISSSGGDGAFAQMPDLTNQTHFMLRNPPIEAAPSSLYGHKNISDKEGTKLSPRWEDFTRHRTRAPTSLAPQSREFVKLNTLTLTSSSSTPSPSFKPSITSSTPMTKSSFSKKNKSFIDLTMSDDDLHQKENRHVSSSAKLDHKHGQQKKPINNTNKITQLIPISPGGYGSSQSSSDENNTIKKDYLSDTIQRIRQRTSSSSSLEVSKNTKGNALPTRTVNKQNITEPALPKSLVELDLETSPVLDTVNSISRTLFALDRFYRQRRFLHADVPLFAVCVSRIRELSLCLQVEREKQKLFMDLNIKRWKKPPPPAPPVEESTGDRLTPAERLIEKFSLKMRRSSLKSPPLSPAPGLGSSSSTTTTTKKRKPGSLESRTNSKNTAPVISKRTEQKMERRRTFKQVMQAYSERKKRNEKLAAKGSDHYHHKKGSLKMKISLGGGGFGSAKSPIKIISPQSSSETLSPAPSSSTGKKRKPVSPIHHEVLMKSSTKPSQLHEDTKTPIETALAINTTSSSSLSKQQQMEKKNENRISWSAKD